MLLLLQALIALKKGAQLLKYGRKGKPKFCPFRLSSVSKDFSGVFVDSLLHVFLIAQLGHS